MSEPKKKIPLAEQHRAAHASSNMSEKYLDGLIEKAAKDGNEKRASELRASKEQFLPAMEALLKTVDPMVEFEDNTRSFLVGLLEKQREADQAKKAAA